MQKKVIRRQRPKKKTVKFEDEGGAIVKPILKKKKKEEKIEEALAYQAQRGGAIKNPILKRKKKDDKVEDALKAQSQKMGGKLFHNPTHKYLWNKLSGRGGRLDSPYCREKMHQLMSRYHPSLFQAYLTGRSNHEKPVFHERTHPNPKPQPAEKRPTFVDMGGSLRSVTHSENGLLQSFDSTFHHHLQLI